MFKAAYENRYTWESNFKGYEGICSWTDGAREIKNHLKKIDSIEILGPVDSPFLKIKNKFRSRLLIRFNGKSLIQKKISKIIESLKISNKIKLTVDVDPVNFG